MRSYIKPHMSYKVYPYIIETQIKSLTSKISEADSRTTPLSIPERVRRLQSTRNTTIIADLDRGQYALYLQKNHQLCFLSLAGVFSWRLYTGLHNAEDIFRYRNLFVVLQVK